MLTTDGFLRDLESGEFIGRCEFRGINTCATTAEIMHVIGKELKKQYPNRLCILVCDTAKIHCALSEGAANPNKINLKDGGKTRLPDNLFGSKGLKTIFDEFFPEVDTTGWNRDNYREELWKTEMILNQLPEMEHILGLYGHLLLWLPIGHPFFNAIEIPWRDVKWDYRVMGCIHSSMLLKFRGVM